MNTLQLARKLRRWIRRTAREEDLPPVQGVADAGWYDSVYRQAASYAEPYWYSRYYFLWALMADRLRSAKAESVLDIGCGPGQFASCLFAIGGITSYVGLDFSVESIAMAERACPRGRFVVGDALTTDLHTESKYDITICTEVLEHIPDDFAVLSRFRGRCLCTVPNFPYQSHVRHFSTTDDVAARYGVFFEHYDVLALRGYRSPNEIYFLVDGVRNRYGT